MEYTEFKKSIPDYISGNLSERKFHSFEQCLKENPEYQIEVDAMRSVWNSFGGDIPEPTIAMDVNFYNMLHSAKQKQQKKNFLFSFPQVFFTGPIRQLVYTFTIMAIGFIAGSILNFEVSDDNSEGSTNSEVEDVRSQLVLALLEQPSATKRLQAVNEVNKLGKITETIIKALFTTLNHDENVNVRLSAVEALSKYTEIPEVRKGLIASIILQDSPLVQIALADLMIVLQEKRAVDSFELLMEKEGIHDSARTKMEKTIKFLI